MLLSPDGWIHFPKPNKNAHLRLFCFPGGGASASLFYSWPRWLPTSIEVAAVQLPGRTPDLDMSPEAGYSMLITEIAAAIENYQELPCAFFGHSQGVLLAFEVARALRARGSRYPERFLFACYPPPHLPRREGFIHAFASESEGNAHALSVFNDSLPLLRDAEDRQRLAAVHSRDTRLWRGYRYQSAAPFTCALTVFGASQDQFVNARSLSLWKAHTNDEFELQMFSGDHFFFYQNSQPLLQAIAQRTGYITA